MHPRPCMHCGANFMRRNPNDEKEKTCNSCIVRENNRSPRETQPFSGMKIQIEVNKKTFSEVEEICMNKGISISEYFTNLHMQQFLSQAERQKSRAADSLPERFGEVVMDDTTREFGKNFESLGKIDSVSVNGKRNSLILASESTPEMDEHIAKNSSIKNKKKPKK